MAALFFYAQPHKTKICGEKHVRKTREIAGFPWWCFQPAGSILNKASNNKAARKEEIYMKLGNSLFHERKKSGLTQEELADKLGVSRQTISKWETRKQKAAT